MLFSRVIGHVLAIGFIGSTLSRSQTNITSEDGIVAIGGHSSTTIKSERGLPRCQARCTDVKTRWEFWWYGVGDVLKCNRGDTCTISTTESKTIGWFVSYGQGIDFGLAKLLSFQFRTTFTWTESYSRSVSHSVEWDGPGDRRLWMKQWFAVTEAKCQPCQFLCYLGPCRGVFGREQAIKIWVPCTDGSCVEYQVSDAHAQCDKSNNCRKN